MRQLGWPGEQLRSRWASYERGVLDTENRLTEEMAVVCKDYCTESWGVAMDRARVPTDSELRRAKNIFFLEDI